MTAPAEAMPLTDCPSGCRAVLDVDALDAANQSILEALGIDQGCEVEVCKVGSPCILKVNSVRLGVGREVATLIRATVTAVR